MCLRGAGAHAQTVHVDVRDNEAASRHEAVVDGDVLAFIDYKIESGRHWLVHTEIDPAHEGVGIGSYLVRSVLDSLRRTRCPHRADMPIRRGLDSSAPGLLRPRRRCDAAADQARTIGSETAR